MAHFCIDDNYLELEGKRLVFHEKIACVIEIDDAIIVLLLPPADISTCENNNVYGVINGEIAWRIQDACAIFPQIASLCPNGTCYTMIKPYEKDPTKLLATEFMGTQYVINPANGVVLDTAGWVK